MNHLYRIKALPFMLWWTACAVFVWPLTVVLAGLSLFPIALIANLLLPSSFYYWDGYDVLLLVVGLPFLGSIIGLAVALLQRWLLRQKLFWAADSWRKWSMIGGALGAYAVAASSWFIEGLYLYGGEDLEALVMMPLFVAFVSGCQWLSLRHAVKDAWLWVFGNIIAGIVFSGLIIHNRPEPYYGTGASAFGAFALAVVVQGIITGYVILHLFEKKLLPMVPEGVDPNRPKSVWDDAI